MEKFIRIDVVADLADGYRRLEKGAHGGSDPLFEVSAQGFEGWVPRMQGRGEPAFGCNKGGVSLHPHCQSFAGRVLGSKDRGGLCTGVDFVTEDGRNEVGALRKVAIKSADADTRPLGNLAHGSVHARGREHRLGRLEQRIKVTLGIGAHAPFRVAPRLDVITRVVRFSAHDTLN